MLITTTDTLQGVEIAEFIGIIYAIAPDLFMVGSGEYAEKMLEDTMEPLIQALKDKGEKVGADAVIGVRFAIANNYIRAYGTAVKYSPKGGAA